jgi:hypothetical protein
MNRVTLMVPFVWIKKKAIFFWNRYTQKVEWQVSRGRNGEFLGIYPLRKR